MFTSVQHNKPSKNGESQSSFFELLIENQKLEQRLKDLESKMVETEIKNEQLNKEKAKIQNAFDYLLKTESKENTKGCPGVGECGVNTPGSDLNPQSGKRNEQYPQTGSALGSVRRPEISPIQPLSRERCPNDSHPQLISPQSFNAASP